MTQQVPHQCASSNHLDCRKVVDAFIDYLEGHASAETRLEIEAHLGACPGCEQYLNEYARATDLAREHMRQNVPDEIVSRLVRAYSAGKRRAE